MPVSYEDFSSVALELLNATPPTEGKLRSSVSRSYYGFYHVALEYADSVSVPAVSDTCGPVHAKLGAYYQTHMHADKQARMDMKQIGWSLKSLHELRCKADYRLDETISHIDADAFYQRCASRISLVQKLMAVEAA
ncbi:hypothetical protein [Pseudomonas brassicacearum]|uniref:hypothetical protein n=1 Tax=Pseudomonas brassicacearum TaxID=930166 RepID=UPI0039E1D955